MGRHGAAGSRRPTARLSPASSAIGIFLICAIGFGVWLWSLRSVSDPVDAHPVDAYAVVVSSPSCTSGAGSTVIDLTGPPVVRSTLSACGRRIGERVAVQYLDGHPEVVRLAGTTVAHESPQGRWLPLAILAAGSLAVLAAIVLIFERRRTRHTSTTGITVAQLQAGSREPAPVTPPSARMHPPSALSAAPTALGDDSDDSPEVTPRSDRPSIPGVPAHRFRADEVVVEGDLFTDQRPQDQDG